MTEVGKKRDSFAYCCISGDPAITGLHHLEKDRQKRFQSTDYADFRRFKTCRGRSRIYYNYSRKRRRKKHYVERRGCRCGVPMPVMVRNGGFFSLSDPAVFPVRLSGKTE